MNSKPAAIRFDPQRRAKAGLKELIKRFVQHLIVEEHRLDIRQRARRADDQRRFELAVEATCCNLLIAAMVGPDTRLSVPRGHGSMWGGGRYEEPVYGQHFLSTVDLLKQLRLIVQTTKGYRYSRKAKQPTTVVASPALAAFLPLGQTSWNDFEYLQASELIVLNACKPKDGSEVSASISYVDTTSTRRWRWEIKNINTALLAAPVSLVGASETVAVLDRMGQPVEPYRCSLRRIFNNGSWNAGGRMFGGFWMNMRREDRFRLIRIDGEEIANVDFSSLFPRLAYVRAGAPQPEGDIYDILGDGACRDGWKTLMNALLFEDKPLRRWPGDSLNDFPKGTKLKDALGAIREKHVPIAPLFGQGLGFELMRHESDMLISVVIALFKQGVTGLPLHDSVLVARSYVETAKALMELEFKHRTGSSRAFVKVDLGQ